jgi:diguanylate cyclase (GGDEF)-like protein
MSEQSLDALLDRIAATLSDLMPYGALHIYEADDARRELVPVFARSPEYEEEIMNDRPAYDAGLTGWAVSNRTPVWTNRADLDPRTAVIPGTPNEPEALIVVPLIARGAVKGALNIYRLGVEARFEEYEFELAKWFGDAAALAIDNARIREGLEHLAQTDSLTGLYNHRYFHERLRAELTRASRSHDSVAVLMFDLDDFKRVNDIYGHGQGDELLAEIGKVASELVRGSDVVCRIGGEEFGVIMPSCAAVDALGLAARLLDRLAETEFEPAGRVTVSVGVAEGPLHAMNPRELIACAEAAMMTAKAHGKNQTVLYGDQETERPTVGSSARDNRSIAHLKMLQSLAGKLNRLNDVRQIGETIAAELRLPGRDRARGRAQRVATGSECARVRVRISNSRHRRARGVACGRTASLRLARHGRDRHLQARHRPVRRRRHPPARGALRPGLRRARERAPLRAAASRGGGRKGAPCIHGRAAACPVVRRHPRAHGRDGRLAVRNGTCVTLARRSLRRLGR